MSALAKGNFKQQMASEPLTTVVIAAGDTFALIVLENGIERWIFSRNCSCFRIKKPIWDDSRC